MDINDLEKKLGIEGLSVDDQMELLDALQKSTQSRLEIANQEAIGKSTQVVIQGLKKIKSDLETRFSQLNATIESKASSLRDGKDGKDGKNGKDGLEGKQGLQGSNGQDGRDGRDGLDGTDGISVVDAKIDFDGSLIITLSDGNILNVGEVVSPDIAEKINVISTMSTNGAVAILDEGTSITSGVKKINFVGASVTATNSGDDVTVNVSAGTGTVTSVAANAGTGISITGSPITTTGTLNITNTAPDQTVALTGAGTTSITGTYPNFTITSNDSATGTVTSVAALTLGTTGTDLGSTVANGTTTPVITLNVPTASATNRGALSSADWTTFNNKGSGTVTSVTGTSPVASSGGATPAISLSSGYGDTLNPYASKTANFVLAAPNGTAGVPTFRAVVAADIPTLNQNTTGSAATLTTGRTIAITGDLAYTSTSFNGSANVTAAGTLATVNTNVGSFTNATLTVNGKGLITAASSGTAPVTSVTATSPVASTGGTTPVISMPAATTSVSGYLTSTDWTTFNNKGSGTITSVTGTAPVVSSGGTTPAISMAAATTSVSGYLTSTDWTTFNNKGSGTVTSVAATVPAFLSVAGSPITTSGTLAITLSGTALPIANGGTGATTLAGASIATYSGTETLTNKRIDPRVTSAASASSLTPNISASDVYAFTALAAGLTINAPTGTPLDGDKLIFRLLDNGTSQTLTWNGTYTVIGVTLPTATTISKTTYVGCIYNANNTRWDVIAVTTQA